MRTLVMKIGTAVVGGALVATMATGCGGSSSTSTQADSGPVTLNFWSWATNVSKVIDVWNKAHPDIQVKVSTQAQGDALVTKLLTANKAGNGPDLAQAEYQALPSLITSGVAADITSSVSGIKGDFSPATWNLTTFGGATYAIPQDVAPMMMYYRTDLFQQYGLAVPTTWDAFAQDAATLHAKDPAKFLTTFSSSDPGWFAGLAQQAGAKWWQADGKSWTVGIDDPATKKVADYWSGLVKAGTVQGQPMYTPQWNKEMNDGTLLAWPSAVWGPGVLEGIAPDTKGKWAMVPMPTWQAGQPAAGFWGGSSTMVSAKSKHQKAALQFATWLNTDPQAVDALITLGSLYPAATKSQSSSALQAAPAFMPNQPNFFTTAADISKTAAGFTWGPDVNVTYGAYSDAFAKAIQGGSFDFSAALSTMQSTTVDDMKKSGFTVK